MYGKFKGMKVCSVPRQEKPFLPLTVFTETTAKEAF